MFKVTGCAHRVSNKTFIKFYPCSLCNLADDNVGCKEYREAEDLVIVYAYFKDKKDCENFTNGDIPFLTYEV